MLILSTTATGCSSGRNCFSEKYYLDIVECEQNKRIEALASIISSILCVGFFGYVLMNNPAWFYRLFRSYTWSFDIS